MYLSLAVYFDSNVMGKKARQDKADETEARQDKADKVVTKKSEAEKGDGEVKVERKKVKPKVDSGRSIWVRNMEHIIRHDFLTDYMVEDELAGRQT